MMQSYQLVDSTGEVSAEFLTFRGALACAMQLRRSWRRSPAMRDRVCEIVPCDPTLAGLHAVVGIDRLIALEAVSADPCHV